MSSKPDCDGIQEPTPKRLSTGNPGTVDPDDLPWLTHPRLVHASLATQRAIQALTIAQRDHDEITQMYENLRRIEDLHPLMARVQGLTEQRRDAGTAANRSTTDVSRQSATLEMCLRGLQKAAGDVLAERERNMGREARLPPQADPLIRQGMRTHRDYGDVTFEQLWDIYDQDTRVNGEWMDQI